MSTVDLANFPAEKLAQTPSVEALRALRARYGEAFHFRQEFRGNSAPPQNRQPYYVLYVQLARRPWTSYSSEGFDAATILTMAAQILLDSSRTVWYDPEERADNPADSLAAINE